MTPDCGNKTDESVFKVFWILVLDENGLHDEIKITVLFGIVVFSVIFNCTV